MAVVGFLGFIALLCAPVITVFLLVILIYCVRIHNRVSGIEDTIYRDLK
jgi:hypothetical protein